MFQFYMMLQNWETQTELAFIKVDLKGEAGTK